MIEGDALAVGLDETPHRFWRKWRQRLERQLSLVPHLRKDSGRDEPVAVQVEALPDSSQVDRNRMFERACDSIDSGKYHLGIALLTRVVNRVPGKAEAWHKLGFAYGQLGRREQAINCYNRVLLLQPRWTEAWNNQGWNRLKSKQVAEAINDFTQALSIDSRFAGAWSNLGYAYRISGEKKQAADAFRMACTYDELNAIHWFNYAKSLARLGDRKGAVKGFHRACELNPGFLRSWIQLILRVRSASEWPRPTESPKQVSNSLGPVENSLPTMGRILPREHHIVSKRAEASQERVQKTWQMIQNPVSWILVIFLAALLYILLGK